MTYSPHLYAALANERQQSLIAWADARRLERQAEQLAASYDLSNVLIRPIQASDAPGLRAAFNRLSAQSRRQRFLGVKPTLSPAEVTYFTDVDHDRHEALVAVDRVGGQGVGVARYIRDPLTPVVADLAVTVVDDWQRHGVGTELMRQLMRRARRSGVCRLTALIAVDNIAARKLLRRLGAPVEFVGVEAGTISYEILLTPHCSGS